VDGGNVKVNLPIRMTAAMLYHYRAWHNDGMKRTTIMADAELLEQLRAVARRDHLSLAEVIRQGMELRVKQQPRRFRFIGAGASTEPPYNVSELASDLQFEPRSWR
jgi:hypothetical protein